MKKNKKNSIFSYNYKKIICNNAFALNLIWKNCPGMIIFRLVLAFFNGILSTVGLYLLGFAINIAQEGAKYHDVMTYILLMIVINIVFNILTGVLNARLNPRFTYMMNKKIKLMILRKASECDLSCYENPQFYQDYTLAMAQCVERIEGTLDVISGFVSSMAALFSISMLAFSIDPYVLIFFFAPILIIFIDRVKMKTNYEIHKKETEQKRRKSYCIRAFYCREYAKEMRVTGIFFPLLERFKATVDESIKVYKTDGVKLALVNFFSLIYSELFSNLFILLYAAYHVLVTKKLQYGDCIILVSAIGNLSYSIQGIIESAMAFCEHAMFIENIRVFMNYENKISVNEDVSFRYKGTDTDVLRHISMKIKKGERIAIVGHNGAGKTTLVKLLLRLYDPDSGMISLSGANIKNINLHSYRDMYSVVLQDFHNFSISVNENVLLRRNKDGDAALVEYALEKSSFTERVKKMPFQTNTVIGKEFDENGEILSGGESQKLAISHIFATNSPIVILDEPSSALDPAAEAEMYSNMMELCRDRTVIIISHRMSSVAMADKIYFIENGEVAENGSHQELMARNGKYAELFHIQAQNYLGGNEA